MAGTALAIASQTGHKEIVKELLTNNADVNVVTNDGQTPLIIASKKGHFEIVDLLIKMGAEINLVKEGQEVQH